MMKSNSPLEIAVVGGGASGLTAAISAARKIAENKTCANITVYEANSRVGKKILVTGNGRCNFTNDNIEINNFRGESDFAFSVYQKFDNHETKNFFRSLGLLAKSDAAGRVYPMSSQASAVLDCLRYEADRLGVNILTDTKITSLKHTSDGFLLNEKFKADKCIIATGGKAAPVHGSDGSGFDLLDSLNLEHTALFPALTPIVCENYPKSLKGIRSQGKISLKCSGKLLTVDTGEIQYTDYGLSGIVSMQVSRFAADAVNKNIGDVYAVVDSCPSMSYDELKIELLDIIKYNPSMPAEMLLAGIIPKRLGIFFLTEVSISPTREIGKLHSAVIDKLIYVVKGKKYRISGVKGFSDAQTTAGGIKACEINAETMETIKIPGLYVCGEIVDVDGECGGYNLQWAWSSGAVAGISSVGGN